MREETEESAGQSRARRIERIDFDYASQPKERLNRCNLCEGAEQVTLAHADRYGYPASSVACMKCGLVVLSPRMTSEAYAGFYNGIYRPLVSAYHGRRIDHTTVKEEQGPYAAMMEGFLAEYLEHRNGESLLDVGGSTGVVAACLAERFGLRPVVLDPAAAELSEAKALGIEVIPSLIETWRPDGRTFEVITLFQTVDHLLDVQGALAKLRSVMSSDGLLVLDIVDFRAAYLRSWSIEAAIKIDHPFYLVEETTEALLARSGLRPIRKVYCPDRLHVLYVCRGIQPVVDALPPPEFVRGFLREIRSVQNAPVGELVLS